MTQQNPEADPKGLNIRSTPFTEGAGRRLARQRRQEEADQRGRDRLTAQDRWIGATGRRPRRRRSRA